MPCPRYVPEVDKHDSTRAKVHGNDAVKHELGAKAHTNGVVFHSITTLEVLSMACCFAAAVKYSLYGAVSEVITLYLLKTCDSYNPCCALFRIKDAHYLKHKQKALFRIPMQHHCNG